MAKTGEILSLPSKDSIQQESNSFLAKTEVMSLTSHEDWNNAANDLQHVQELKKNIEAFFKESTQITDKAHKVACKNRDTMLNPVKAREKIIKHHMSGYYLQCDEMPGLEVPKSQCASVVPGWDIDIVDILAIPDEFLVPDLTAIKARVKSLGKRHGIPGIKVSPTASIRGR